MRTEFLPFIAVIVLIAILVGVPMFRAYLRAIYRLLTRRRRRPVATSHRATVIEPSGEEFQLPGDTVVVQPAWQTSIEQMLRMLNRDGSLRTRILVAMMAIGILLLLPRMLSGTRADEFTVFIAPFQEAGSVTQTGRALANQLAAELPQASGGRITTRVLDAPPADAIAALALIERQDADILIWGDVTPGGMLDQASLTPRIVYRPSGGFAPNSLIGYSGRFALPDYYPISNTPINGALVLPAYLGALADYAAGRFDPAYETFGSLLEEQPALLPILPGTVRATILWARADYAAAAAEYRNAAGPLDAPPIPDAAMLHNNLGAVLQDAGDPTARDALNSAVALLAARNEGDLGELRLNLGIEALRTGDTTRAIIDLEVARTLLPTLGSLELALAEAYRESGRLGDADPALAIAFRRISSDDMRTIDQFRNATTEQLRARWQYQDALLNLARLVGARSRLLWELEADPVISVQELTLVRADLDRAIATTSELTRIWNRHATAADAAGAPISGRVAASQALRATEMQRDMQRWHAFVEAAILRIEGARPPQGFAAVWAILSGQRTPSQEEKATLEAILRDRPTDVDALLGLARINHLLGEHEEAIEHYNAADRNAPDRPEALLGLARIALDGNDQQQARQLLESALQRNADFFPAHTLLAHLARQDEDWPVAIREYRWLAERRSSFANTLALAEVLRLSGPTGYAQAEELLLIHANSGNVDALIELSRLYHVSGDIAGSREMLQRAQEATARTSARFADVAYALGELLDEEGRRGEARVEYERALSTNPQHIPSLLALARSETEPAAATGYYEAALTAGADDPLVLKQIGATLLALRAYEPALMAFERATTTPAGGNDPENHYGMALAYIRLDRLESAQREAQQALTQRGGNYPEAMIILGDVALARGALPDAVAQYERALSLNDNLALAHIGLGRSEAAAGRWAVAAGHFRNAIDREPDLADGHLWLGEALLQQSEARSALASFQQALVLRSDDAEIYYGIARSHYLLGQIGDARTQVDRALAHNATYPEALLLRARIEETQERDDQAIEYYRRAIEARRPSTPVQPIAEAHFRRGLLLIQRDRIDEARRDLEEAARLQPEFAEASYWLGRVYFAQDNLRDARERFRRAVALQNGRYAEAQFYQGRAEEQAGQRTEAIASYRAAIEQGIDTIWATEARSALTRLGEP
ncbi:MAG TPA: tetratricopeptide repeat protein [Roseiflexaceae bacterium]|nr:tetratricopeptide repeat protein [Roseiflexaceae bacterium]